MTNEAKGENFSINKTKKPVNSGMHPDQRYIQALLNNDEKLLYELYQKCFPSIRMWMIQNNGSEENAADIFQDCLIDLLKKAKRKDFLLASSICSYLQGMCKYKWYDELEKRKREMVTFAGFTAPSNIMNDNTEQLQDQHLQEARLDLIREKFQELGERCKELLSLSWSTNKMGKKRSTEEIAEMLKVTNGYVRKKKSECIVKLIKLVMDHPEFKNLKQ